MRRRAFAFLFCALLGAGCTSEGSRYGSGYQFGNGGPSAPGNGFGFYGGGHGGSKVALLLPMSGPRAQLGQTLLNAVQLAFHRGPSPEFDVLDTAGTPAGAAAAANTAVSNGDGLVIGPLTSAETGAVAPITTAAGLPVLAFTNDSAQARPGVWPLGITPDQQVRRLVVAAQGQGKVHFASLLPETDYGRAMGNALRASLQAAGLGDATMKTHGPGMTSITAAVRDLADYANRRGPIDSKVKALRARGTPEARREAQEVARSPIPPPPFDVLLLADTGDNLQEIAAVLPYYDVDRSAVQIIGPALWADSSSGSSAVHGAWYAAPDNNGRSNFANEYEAHYGATAPAIADLAFDAASIARVVMGERGADPAVLTQPAGFVGSDGWITLSPTGQVERGLAVFRVERGGPTMIEPAPEPSSAAGL